MGNCCSCPNRTSRSEQHQTVDGATNFSFDHTILETFPQRDIQGTVPQRDIRETSPQRDILRIVPRRDIRGIVSQTEIRETVPQRDIRAFVPLSGIRISTPQREIRVTDQQTDILGSTPLLTSKVAVPQHGIRVTASQDIRVTVSKSSILESVPLPRITASTPQYDVDAPLHVVRVTQSDTRVTALQNIWVTASPTDNKMAESIGQPSSTADCSTSSDQSVARISAATRPGSNEELTTNNTGIPLALNVTRDNTNRTQPPTATLSEQTTNDGLSDNNMYVQELVTLQELLGNLSTILSDCSDDTCQTSDFFGRDFASTYLQVLKVKTKQLAGIRLHVDKKRREGASGDLDFLSDLLDDVQPNFSTVVAALSRINDSVAVVDQPSDGIRPDSVQHHASQHRQKDHQLPADDDQSATTPVGDQ